MEKKSFQFGVWALFVLTAAAAVCFAVLRLPLHAAVKILIIQIIVLGFYRWAACGRHPLDPRPMRMLQFATSTPLMVYIVWSYIRMRTHSLLVFDCIFGVLTLLFLIPCIWYAIGAVRYAIEASRR